MFEFLKKIFSVYFDEKSRRTIVYVLGFKFKCAGKALKENKFSIFRDNGGDIKDAPKADGLPRVIQLANFEILKLVDDICKEHNLDLWLTFGTLLGAVRHKGFIPWDDDIDVEMPRAHYNKLYEILKSNQDKYGIYPELMRKTDVNLFMKIRHKYSKKVFIDITPVDETKTQLSKSERLKLSNKIKKYRALMNFKIRFYIKNNDVEEFVNYINKKSEQFFKFSKKPDIENSDIVWGMDFQHKVNEYLVYSHSTYFPLKEIEFEGRKFKCVNDPHIFLSEMYGEYMSWPSKLYTHHSSFKKGTTARDFYGDEMMDELIKMLNMSEEEINNI